MAHYTLELPYLAPIPVGHRVAVEVYLRTAGIFATHVEPDRSNPVVVDQETGIRWQSSQPDPNDPQRALHRTDYGRVRACEITTGGGNYATVRTVLTIDPTEPPGAHGAFRSDPRSSR